MNLTKAEMQLAHGALIRAINYEEESIAAHTGRRSGKPLRGYTKNVRQSEAFIKRAKKLLEKMRSQP